MSNNSVTAKKDIDMNELANVSIRLAQVINLHLKENDCKHDIHDIVKEVFLNE
jgi:hypothetical protein